MDGGFRSSRPAERRVVDRSESVHRQQPATPQPVPESPAPAHRESTTRRATKKDKKPSRRFMWLIIAIAVVVLGAGGWFAWSHLRGVPGIESDKYQAVFFTNGQVYFGKLHKVDSEYMKLTDVYYLQTQSSEVDSTDSENPQDSTSSESNNVQLIKLGSEIHGPEDAMIISKDQVLFFENLKPKGKVSQTIEKSKKGNDF